MHANMIDYNFVLSGPENKVINRYHTLGRKIKFPLFRWKEYRSTIIIIITEMMRIIVSLLLPATDAAVL